MNAPEGVFAASEKELLVRRNGLIFAARQFLDSHPDALAIVYIGSVLFKKHEEETHFDTDFIVISKPEFISTTEEVNVMMGQCLAVACEHHQVNLPYPDAHDVYKVRRPGDPVVLGKFQRDYGDLVVGRHIEYFESPSDRTEFTITRY